MVIDLYRSLLAEIGVFKKVLVAFSGGIDSSLLLKIAVDGLGAANVLAVMVSSVLVPEQEKTAAGEAASRLKVELRTIDTNPLALEAVARNHRDRCFFCKQHLFDLITEVAVSEGYAAVLEGSNVSDIEDYRPGMDAVRGFQLIRSPFIDGGVTKQQIRQLAQYCGLSNWDKPSEACLASRVPYGTRITPHILGSVAAAEKKLHKMDLRQLRVRYHGELARIEISPGELPAVLNLPALNRISEAVKSCGFAYAALDLEGYRTGSMNEAPPLGKCSSIPSPESANDINTSNERR